MKAPRQIESVINSKKAGKMIRRGRKLAGIGQTALAVEMKIDKSYLCLLESGQRNWTDNLFTLACLAINKLKQEKKS